MRRPEELNELIEALHDATKGHKAEVLSKIDASLKHESDRGCVIFGAALISDGLERLLRAYLRQTPDDAKLIDSLFQGYSPLATFSAKLQLAYAFGIIPRQLRDKIELVRRLRNEFAHESGPLTFDDERCANRLESLLKLLLEEFSFKEVVGEDAHQSGPERVKGSTDAKRVLFTIVLTYILGFLQSLTLMGKAGLSLRDAAKTK